MLLQSFKKKMYMVILFTHQELTVAFKTATLVKKKAE